MSKSEPTEQARRQIDENLKRVFQEQVDQELPERFRNLLDQLQNQGSKKDESESK